MEIVLPVGDDVINDLTGFHQSYSESQFLTLSKHKLKSHFFFILSYTMIKNSLFFGSFFSKSDKWYEQV